MRSFVRRPLGVALTAGFLGLAIASPAGAQAPPGAASPDPTDEELIERGIELRKEGRDAEALEDFERARDMHPSARAATQVALAHEALGHWREAERGLTAVMNDPNDEWVVRHRVYIENSLAALQEHLAWLEVESSVAGTEVWVAGEFVGRSPLDGPIRVVAGPVIVEARSPGYATIQRTLRVDPRSQVHEEFTFAPKKSTTDEPSMPAYAHAHGGPSKSTVRTAGWITVGAAGGLLLIGVAGAVTREWEAQIYNDDSQCAPSGNESRYDRCATNRNIGSTAETIAVASFVGSGIAAAASGALLFGGWGAAPAAPTARHIGCGVIGLGLECRGVF